MEYEETYHGRRIIVTTVEQTNGEWKAKAELVDTGGRTSVGAGSTDSYRSEEAARAAALSGAAAAIDASRIRKGKP
jgi:hypothetical protein